MKIVGILLTLFTLSLTFKREFRIATATCCPDCSKWKESPEFGTKMHMRVEIWQILFLFKGVFNCVAYFMDLKCENLTFSFLQENINLISSFIPLMHLCANFHSFLQLRTILMLNLWTNGNIIINKIPFVIACKGTQCR